MLSRPQILFPVDAVDVIFESPEAGPSAMSNPARTVFAVVLAAGSSSRFGATKQSARIHDVPLVQRAVDAAVGACGQRVVTVIGHDRVAVLQAMGASSGFVIVNEDYEAGLGSSIAAAAHRCGPHADALLLILADQALVTAAHLRTLVDASSGSDVEIVASAYDDTVGPPALLPRATFRDLCELSGDSGARALFFDHRFRLKTVPCDAAAVDIDTPADLAALT